MDLGVCGEVGLIYGTCGRAWTGGAFCLEMGKNGWIAGVAVKLEQAM